MKVLAIFAALVAAVYCSGDAYTVIDHCYPYVNTVEMYAINGSKLFKQGVNETWTDVTTSPCVSQTEDGYFHLTCDIDFAIYEVRTDEEAKAAAEAAAKADAADSDTATTNDDEEGVEDYEEEDVYNYKYIVQCSEHCFSNITDNSAVAVEVPTTTDSAHQYYLFSNNKTIAAYNVTSKKRTATTPSKVTWSGNKLNFKKSRDIGVYYWVGVYYTSVTDFDGKTTDYEIYRVKEIFHLNKGVKSRNYSCYPDLASPNMVTLCANAEPVEDTDSVTADTQ